MRKPWNSRKASYKGRHRKSRTRNNNTVAFREPVAVEPRFKPNGRPGTRPEAVIIDMDGTLENWDGHPNPPGLEYAERHHSEGRVLIILTARDHEWSYRHTHDWLVKHLDIPFVGPICRPADDQRYACDFKRAVHDQLSSVYDIVSAIDDDNYVLEMWRSIPTLEVVETGYTYNTKREQVKYAPANELDIQRGTWEPDEDELAWLNEYEKEIQEAKRRQPKPVPSWIERWEEDSLDVYCNHCDHPWFEHDITGCTAVSDCKCAG